MLFGAITAEGLVPRKAPIFFTEYLKKKCKKIGKKKCTLDNKIYADFISKDFVKHLNKDLEDPLDDYIWQDDGDKKHRTKHVLGTLSETFAHRVNTKFQCDKYADVWPIENVWAIIYQWLPSQDFENIEQLKKGIKKVWKQIDSDLCNKMMESIPRRLKAVIARKGEQ
eukprot:244985_1